MYTVFLADKIVSDVLSWVFPAAAAPAKVFAMGAHCVKVGNDPEPIEYFKSPPAMLLGPIALSLLQQGFWEGIIYPPSYLKTALSKPDVAGMLGGLKGPGIFVKHVDVSLGLGKSNCRNWFPGVWSFLSAIYSNRLPLKWIQRAFHLVMLV